MKARTEGRKKHFWILVGDLGQKMTKNICQDRSPEIRKVSTSQ